VVNLSAKGVALLGKAPEPAQARLIRVLESLPRKGLARLAATLELLATAMGAPGGPAPMFFEKPPSPSRRRGAGKPTSRKRGARGRA